MTFSAIPLLIKMFYLLFENLDNPPEKFRSQDLKHNKYIFTLLGSSNYYKRLGDLLFNILVLTIFIEVEQKNIKKVHKS